MNLFHKPRTCNGKNGLVNNGINKSTKSANNKKYAGVWKFLLGILGGLILGSQLQSLLISSSFCVPNKTSVFPIHQRQLKVRSEPFTAERALEETRSKTLVSNFKLKQLLLVGVMTADKYISTRAKAVYETWGKQVPGKILFFTADTQNVTDMDLPVVRLKGVDDSYPPQKKSFMMLKYMYEHYGDKFEWFMRADDDVFVRTERLSLFLKNVNSSKASFIGQAGKGILEEFGLLSLEYDENFCMGGPGMILSHVTLARVAPHVRECLKNLYTTHEDVELGRCVQKFAGIPCTWSYEMQNIFYHNSSGRLAFTGPLKSREVHRAITLHPVKQYNHMYRLFNYLQSLSVRERIYEGLRIRREMSGSIHQLEKRLSPTWRHEDIFQLETLGLGPSLNKFVPHTEDEMLTWNFVARAVDSIETINPRRTIDAPLREGVEDVIREVMESINAPSKERGRIIDFKELLYGYYRVNPRLGVDYILDLLLVYKKYRGRKMMFPVRRHAYLQQAFGPLVVRSHEEPSSSSSKRIHLILPLSGRLLVFRRFMENVRRVCAEPDEDVRLIIVLYPTLDGDDPSNEIKELVEDYRKRSSQNPKGKRGFELELIEQTGEFARASALEMGQSSCRDDDDDCLLFFIDVDMIFDSRTLERIRTHTIRGRQAYFPIVFSQFDPFFVGTTNTSAAAPNDVSKQMDDVFEINEDRGYWRFYGFGLAGLYRSDLHRVGGMNTSIHGWGQEDVDLYDRVVASTLAVFRAPDPGLIHVFHPIDCLADSMGAKQRKMCLGTKASTYASQRRLARYWIDSHHPTIS